jgi:hypothetical protein
MCYFLNFALYWISKWIESKPESEFWVLALVILPAAAGQISWVSFDIAKANINRCHCGNAGLCIERGTLPELFSPESSLRLGSLCWPLCPAVQCPPESTLAIMAFWGVLPPRWILFFSRDASHPEILFMIHSDDSCTPQETVTDAGIEPENWCVADKWNSGNMPTAPRKIFLPWEI